MSLLGHGKSHNTRQRALIYMAIASLGDMSVYSHFLKSLLLVSAKDVFSVSVLGPLEGLSLGNLPLF